MVFPKKYKSLVYDQVFFEEYKIIPIRFEDRIKIMNWRNEQMYHLRQDKLLTNKDQDNYYKNTISKLFNEEKPNQIIFSFLKNDELIGYGGLVRINWIDQNAEISFIMNTNLEEKNFKKNWTIFLLLIEKIGFNQLNLKKIYVYAFDLRIHLYEVLLESNYFLDARLTNHCFFNNSFLDVVIHSKLNNLLD